MIDLRDFLNQSTGQGIGQSMGSFSNQPNNYASIQSMPGASNWDTHNPWGEGYSGEDISGENQVIPGQTWTGDDSTFTYPGMEYFDQLGGQFQDWMTNGMVSEPSAFAEALGYLTPFAKSGRAVDTSGIYKAQQAVSDRYLQEKAADLAEQFGVSGLRWSTPLQSGITRETERMAENMGLSAAQAKVAAQENAMTRALQAIGQMGNIGGMQGQFGLGAAGLQQGAANALYNLAGTQAMMPLTIGQGMMGLQGQMEDMQNTSLQGSQVNPYLSYAMQMAGMNPNTYAAKQPSGFEQLLNIGSDWLAKYMSNRTPTTATPKARDMSDVWSQMGW